MNLSCNRAGRSVLLALVAMCLMTSASHAGLILIQSDPANSSENLGTFTGTLDYNPGIGSGTLIISITNTSPVANGGFLTGFAFNIDSADAGALATLQPGATHPFLDTGSENAPPFGTYDAGAALGADWSGGGSPNSGIAVGATGTFTFNVVASDAASLTASSFINGPNEFDFVVRFRGFKDGGSDKVPSEIVPAPSVLSLLVIGVAGTRRRRS